MSIAVLGAGAWGTALAQAWAENGRDVTLLARTAPRAAEMKSSRRCPQLPGITLSEKLEIESGFEALAHATTIACVTPAQTLRQVLTDATPHLAQGATLVLCCKGIDRETGLTMVETVAALGLAQNCTVLSGPSFAHDVARGRPTAVTLAAPTIETAQTISQDLSTPSLRLYASADIAGAEAGGALKNVLALAVGVARGLSLGASAEAALITRGFVEMTRLAVAMGAQKETLSGLSGLGDLVLTCSSPQSRNFAYGMALGRSEDLMDRPLAEGVHTARAALALAKKASIDVPIMEAVAAILDGKVTPEQAVAALLSRPLKSES